MLLSSTILSVSILRQICRLCDQEWDRCQALDINTVLDTGCDRSIVRSAVA